MPGPGSGAVSGSDVLREANQVPRGQLDSACDAGQSPTEVTLRRGALSVCPLGDPWGTSLQLAIGYFLAPIKPPKGQTL
eukprot:10883886-Heterocapsa_arctica.AAC.1